MPAQGNYSAQIPKAEDTGSETDLRSEMSKISKEDAVEYTQDFVDEKLSDAGFYGYVQGAAEGVDGSGESIQDFLDSKTPEEIARMAEQYETDVKPVIVRIETFLGTEFLNKVSVLDPKGKKSATESVSSYLGKKAGSDPKAFLDEYPPLIAKYDELDAQSKAAKERLQKNYRSSDSQELTQRGANYSLEAQRGETVIEANKQEHKDKRRGIGRQFLNIYRKVKNFLSWNFKGKPEFRSPAEIEEDEAYDRSQEPLTLEVDHLRGLTENIKGDLAKKVEIDDKIATVREQLIQVLSDSDEIREAMQKATEAALANSKGYDVNKAAESLDAIAEVWDDGNNPSLDGEMLKMLETVYKKEIEDSVPDSKAKNIDKAKMEAFDKFLKANMNSAQARETMERVIDEQIAALDEAAARSPKGAQLARMKSRVRALAA